MVIFFTSGTINTREVERFHNNDDKLLSCFHFILIKGTETAVCHKAGDRNATDPPLKCRKSHGKNKLRQEPINRLLVRMIKN